jgi:malate dehydrogenase (oxaloacetate-decarboxylating)
MPITPSAQYSLTLRVEIDHQPGMLGKVASAIGDAGGTIGAVDLVQADAEHTIRDITVETADAADWPRLTEAVNSIPGARVLDATDRTFLIHAGGKIEVNNKVPVKTREDLSMAYTPGVARVCEAIYLLNALELTGRRIEDIGIVVCGLGAEIGYGAIDDYRVLPSR